MKFHIRAYDETLGPSKREKGGKITINRKGLIRGAQKNRSNKFDAKLGGAGRGGEGRVKSILRGSNERQRGVSYGRDGSARER